MYNVADAAIVGRFLGPKALAAVGASSSVQFLVLGFCIGICCGFGIPIAQRFGGKDYRSMRAYIWPLYFIVQSAFEHTSCRWRQQNTFFVFGVFHHTKYYLGSGLHRCLSLGLCRCCNCNDHRSGDQRTALSRVYTKEGTDTAVLGSLLRSTSYRLVCLLCAQLKKRKEYK